jgi:hypothetical protein
VHAGNWKKYEALLRDAADLDSEAKDGTAHWDQWRLLCKDGLQAQHILARPSAMR